ncbi:hypothetical protein ACFYZ9_07135 [Streptomyces sp. NPDC001691]|uniref:hypothetical protein n=1 Tax=Streptomyces sp. NPDC001691 TaxID=3364600 RepID=UPI00368087AE
MISPDKVPSYTGDIGAVEVEVGRLRKAAQTIREHGGDVNTRFRNLSTVYRAPEAEYLFQTTQGVHDTSADFASRLETVAGALETYASEIRPLVDKLERLRFEAAAFVASVQGQGDVDPKWHHDKAKMAAHNALMHEVAATVRAFQDAEVAAADRITAVVGGTQWHLANGSPKQSNPYGFSAGQLEGEAKLPWGTPEHFSYLPFGLDWHFQQFGESLGENIKGVATGFVDMFRPGQQGQDTRKGLLMTIVGAEDYLRDPDGNRPMDPLGPEGRPYAKAFAKSLVGWDDWKTNPGKAAGTVVFNALTFASGPLGVASKVGTAGKVGEAASVAARTAGVLSKVGEVLDPVGATAKVVGTGARALPKVSELAKNIAAVTKVTSEASGVHSIIDLKGGSKLHIGDGSFTISKDGIPNTKPAPHELPADQRVPSTTPAPEHELVGVGGRAPEASAHAGEHLPPRASHESTGGGGSGDSGRGGATNVHSGGHDTGHASEHPGAESHRPGSHVGHDSPMGEGVAHHPSGGGAGYAGDHGPGTPTHPGSGPLELGGEAEHRIREAIRQIPKNTMKPKVIEKAIQRLSESPSGAEIAEIISSGRLSHAPGYRDAISMLGSGLVDHPPRAIDQLRLGNQFYEHGFHNVAFEIKNQSIKADIDVKVTDANGESYGYQLKRLKNPKNPFENIAKADNLGQLSKSENVTHKVMLIDGQGTVADWKARGIPEELLQVHRGVHPVKSEKGRGILFVLRLGDGTIVIPPGAMVDPGGVL